MVITLDKNKKPLGWCKPERASGLLKAGRAVIYRYFPFTIILKNVDARKVEVKHSYRIKIDPGSKETGVSVVEFAPDGSATVILFVQIKHRGESVKDGLRKRNSSRRNRRFRETRYRHCKFPKGHASTARPKGWISPSQHSIADNTINFVNKLIRFLGPCDVTVESVKFDTQLLENPNIEGTEYQHGTLYGCELKSYLLEKYHHTCQYCGGESRDHRLEWEHKIPKSRDGSDSVKNATLSCHTCNKTKDDRTPEEWLASLEEKKKLTKLEESQCKGIKNVIAGKSASLNLRYAAWANITRFYPVDSLKALQGVKSLEQTTGGRTAYNRYTLGYKKDHHIDALVAGKHNPTCRYRHDNQPVLHIEAMGRGTRFRGQTSKCGIITVKYKHSSKRVSGVQTGDIVRTDIPNGKHKGTFTGRIMVRSSGSHDIRCMDGKLVTTTKRSKITVLQPGDGYQYKWKAYSTIPLGNSITEAPGGKS